jgi:hypothetical protein
MSRLLPHTGSDSANGHAHLSVPLPSALPQPPRNDAPRPYWESTRMARHPVGSILTRELDAPWSRSPSARHRGGKARVLSGDDGA